eukprot:TRINITY_DN9906_c1_g1_i1.p2 TRINITY_DN9906_c1_g1~~TRINITY_DN9906_c1_g1_i1.p2  ORF type:complete len:101 (-),score=15.01 TRINITY_DN9906_c1_g1_i1:243-545(-)
MEAQIKALELPPGLHWIRLYHGKWRKGLENEALLDNAPSTVLANTLAAQAWPPVRIFYSARIFLMILDAEAASNGPESLAERLPLPVSENILPDSSEPAR